MNTSEKIKECKRLINILKRRYSAGLNLFICNITGSNYVRRYEFIPEFKQFLQDEMRQMKTKYPEIAETVDDRMFPINKMIDMGHALWDVMDLTNRVAFLQAVIKNLKNSE